MSAMLAGKIATGGNMEENAATRSDQVKGLLDYLRDTGERPVVYLYEPPPGVPIRSGESIKHTMPVYDGREVADRLTLDSQGFAFVRNDSEVENFYDPDEVRSVYYPEVARLVKQVTGAFRVEVFDHNVRCEPMAGKKSTALTSQSSLHTTTTLSNRARSACVT
jgi:hypothetical protein